MPESRAHCLSQVIQIQIVTLRHGLLGEVRSLTMKIYRAGLLGAGDFVRIQTPVLQKSQRLRVTSVYDPNAEAARTAAGRLAARVVDSPDAIFGDPEVDTVLVYTPPFTRLEL